MPDHPADHRWMALALSLGRRGMGRTWPNPAVGCVIVKAGRIVGRGWTAPGGRPHAEPQALAQAGAAAKGATAYVTLEPCAHHGQTPPCAEALVEAGIAEVVSALEDPDPRVAGKGHDILRAAGISVRCGILADQARRDHAGFLLAKTRARPLVTLKLASSFDGRIATSQGESQWITGAEARRFAHYLRATHDAVMIGAGTARADDPTLNVRGLGMVSQPVRLVLDSRLSTDPASALGRSATATPVWICHSAAAPAAAIAAWQKTGATLIVCAPDASGRLKLPEVLRALAARGLTRLFCEGGGVLAAALLAEGLVDELVHLTAGLALGADGTPAVAALPPAALADYPRFTLVESRVIGADHLQIWRRDPSALSG